jgi:large subunit ribosomal protein L20
MTRTKRGRVARKYRKKVLALAKGAIGSNFRLFRIAKQHTIKAIVYAYRGSRERKRQNRSCWLIRLNAEVRLYNWKYSSFFYYLRKKKCLLNRKVLAQLAIYDPVSFQNLMCLLCISFPINKIIVVKSKLKKEL